MSNQTKNQNQSAATPKMTKMNHKNCWQFHFARRIWYHVGSIQTSYHTTKEEAIRTQLKRKEQGWAVWEVIKINNK
jgi:hypothetical protein